MKEIFKFLGINTKYNELDIVFTLVRNELICVIQDIDDIQIYNENATNMLRYLGGHVEDIMQAPNEMLVYRITL